MIRAEILEVLCCPETHQRLTVALPEQITQLGHDGVLNRSGKAVPKRITAGLVREDGRILYPIWDDIPCLLIEEGIPLVQDRASE